MPFQPGHKLAGSRKGKPNRFKRDARQAIALFVDRNTPKLQRWLNAVADGRREPNKPDGTAGDWIVKPNPARAFELFQSVIEYHVPRLSRTEVVRQDSVSGRVIDSSQLTAEQREQLRQMILAQAEPVLLEAQPVEVPRGTLAPDGLGDAQVVESIDPSE